MKKLLKHSPKLTFASWELASWELASLLKSSLKDKKLIFDSNGHIIPGPANGGRLFNAFKGNVGKELKILKRAIENKKELSKPLTITERWSYDECRVCGEHINELETNGLWIRPTSPCPYPDGIRLEFEL